MTPQKIDYVSLNSSHRHIRYKIIQKTYGQVISDVELVVKAQYLYSMQENTNWYWKQQPLKHNIIFSTRTILRLRLDVITIRYVQDIPKNICNSIRAKKSIQRHPIIMTDADYYNILDET